jgi:hypothetical protein
MTNTGTDSGYAFYGPEIVDRTMPLKNGLILKANRQSGVGKTLGMVCSRADDHYMPTWEMHWRIDL